jgi:hypothetical protein
MYAIISSTRRKPLSLSLPLSLTHTQNTHTVKQAMYPLKQPFLYIFAFKISFLIGREEYCTLISLIGTWNRKHCPVTCPLISVPLRRL